MIFITAGTIHFPFQRMHDLAELIAKKMPGEKIIYQYGNTVIPHKHENIEYHKLISPSIFHTQMSKARLIITHGGPATIYQSLYLGKKPWVIPRLKKNKEHINDHQVYFSHFMYQKKLVSLVKDNYSEMLRVGSRKIDLNKIQHHNREAIIHYLDKILNNS